MGKEVSSRNGLKKTGSQESKTEVGCLSYTIYKKIDHSGSKTLN
jgi:hypothetical protein